MVEVLFAISPVFLLIVLGHLLRRGGIPNVEFWNLNDKLVYWVLMPALIFHKTSTNTFSADLVGSYATVVMGAFFCAVVFSLALAAVFKLPAPAMTSVLQGGARHNTFIALAVAGKVFGPEGLALAVLVTALLIPVTNLTVVPCMTVILSGADRKHLIGQVLRDLGRNPLLAAVLLGTTLNLSGIGEIPVLHQSAALLGNAALPIVLMCVGANLRIRAMQSSLVPVLISSAGKLILFPLVIVFLSQWLGLSALETSVALLFGAAPTASAAFTLARQMGGDAPLMAAIVTIQTVLAFVTMPLTLQLADQFLH